MDGSTQPWSALRSGARRELFSRSRSLSFSFFLRRGCVSDPPKGAAIRRRTPIRLFSISSELNGSNASLIEEKISFYHSLTSSIKIARTQRTFLQIQELTELPSLGDHLVHHR